MRAEACDAWQFSKVGGALKYYNLWSSPPTVLAAKYGVSRALNNLEQSLVVFRTGWGIEP